MADAKLAGQLVMKLFHARTNAHVLHLSTRSYAQHKALDDFYSGIVDLADSFAECYQGKYDLIPVEGKYIQHDKPIAMLTELRTWIGENRSKVLDAKDTELSNLLDEVISLIDGTLYKLRFLA
jgi:hypothetical protein